MKTLLILFCSILLATVEALSQSGPQTILISTRTNPASAGQDTRTIANYFETKVEALLMKEYPCAQPMAISDIGALLKLSRQQAIMGADESLPDVAGAIGAKYTITLTVTEFGSGQLALNASMMNTATVQTQARGGTITGGGDAALDAVEALAKQFVDSLSGLTQFSASKCNPTNPWAGIITYKLKENPPESTNEHEAVSGPGTVTTTTTSTVQDDVTIRIGWTGQPQAGIVASQWFRNEEIGKVRMRCGRPTIASQPPEWRSGGWDYVDRTDNTAGGDVEAAVSVEIANGRYNIRVQVPAIKGETVVTELKHNDGGCGNPSDHNPDPIKVPWEHDQMLLQVNDKPLRKPNELQGSDNDPSTGGIITWDLTRTPMRK